MAKKVTVRTVDDLDGEDPAAETVQFCLDGITYQIDLSADHAAKLRYQFATWTQHAHRIGIHRCSLDHTGPRRRTSADRKQTAAIRQWANENGHQVSPRGRISAHIVDAFNKAHHKRP
ncbi:Protein lsr2 precursor [Mycobacteroides abscessus subsp. bolletii]|uniref:histone-like nucleoid-structuring protein Lsr2 n=1 Tax=Mycobacteroides abscessus TaxID=36809 RepID=UPI00092820DC|nr:Lsr2 family protein [Mycobacteroides abscessus]SIJ06018.1 Protein lsr2 precursor [Mycobacteroides abscessus subsp. bolletii]SLD78624.1 Protein lsr2 precursor [Mycobacteroides abscessus subsp. bolletii]SLD85861.1 Protein lsr2 precursor [Mycobacteroides abscessus subsp. bolletii]